MRGARQAARRARGRHGERRALASEPGEIVFEGDFYDYEAKYTPGGMELLVPARISARARASGCASWRCEAFARAGCDGLARVDFFVDGEQVLVNELNTMPGFTPTSVYAKLLDGVGGRLPGARRPALPAGASSATRRCGAAATARWRRRAT